MNTPEIRQWLEGLESEYAEIQALLEKERTQLRQLEGEGIKAFDQVITTQGRVGALERMEAEQAVRVQQAREKLRAAETQEAYEEHLAFIGSCAQEIEDARAEMLTHRDALYAALVEHLPLMVAASTRWGRARKAWIDRASTAGIRVMRMSGDEEGTKVLYQELTDRGVDTGPLRWHRHNTPEVQGYTPVPHVPYPDSGTLFGNQLGRLVDNLQTEGEVIAHRVENGLYSTGTPVDPRAEMSLPPIAATPLAVKTDPTSS